MKYCFIKDHCSEFPVVKMCHNLDVSVSGFYDWQRRNKSGRQITEEGIMVHSDRGIQYATEQFRSLLDSIHSVQSMSRKENSWDNAVVESFFIH